MLWVYKGEVVPDIGDKTHLMEGDFMVSARHHCLSGHSCWAGAGRIDISKRLPYKRSKIGQHVSFASPRCLYLVDADLKAAEEY